MMGEFCHTMFGSWMLSIGAV